MTLGINDSFRTARIPAIAAQEIVSTKAES
jgi:hypothetical protein